MGLDFLGGSFVSHKQRVAVPTKVGHLRVHVDDHEYVVISPGCTWPECGGSDTEGCERKCGARPETEWLPVPDLRVHRADTGEIIQYVTGFDTAAGVYDALSIADFRKGIVRIDTHCDAFRVVYGDRVIAETQSTSTVAR